MTPRAASLADGMKAEADEIPPHGAIIINSIASMLALYIRDARRRWSLSDRFGPLRPDR